ncbi:MAG: DUF5615 family PIN-like protein [Desulfococcaceae bacterium]
MGIPPKIVLWLRQTGHDAFHLHEQNLDRMPDSGILQKAPAEKKDFADA